MCGDIVLLGHTGVERGTSQLHECLEALAMHTELARGSRRPPLVVVQSLGARLVEQRHEALPHVLEAEVRLGLGTQGETQTER